MTRSRPSRLDAAGWVLTNAVVGDGTWACQMVAALNLTGGLSMMAVWSVTFAHERAKSTCRSDRKSSTSTNPRCPNVGI